MSPSRSRNGFVKCLVDAFGAVAAALGLEARRVIAQCFQDGGQLSNRHPFAEQPAPFELLVR